MASRARRRRRFSSSTSRLTVQRYVIRRGLLALADDEVAGETDTLPLAVTSRRDSQRTCGSALSERIDGDEIGSADRRTEDPERVDLAGIVFRSRVVSADAVQAEDDASAPQDAGLALHARERAVLPIDEKVVARRRRQRAQQLPSLAQKRRGDLPFRDVALSCRVLHVGLSESLSAMACALRWPGASERGKTIRDIMIHRDTRDWVTVADAIRQFPSARATRGPMSAPVISSARPPCGSARQNVRRSGVVRVLSLGSAPGFTRACGSSSVGRAR